MAMRACASPAPKKRWMPFSIMTMRLLTGAIRVPAVVLILYEYAADYYAL